MSFIDAVKYLTTIYEVNIEEVVFARREIQFFELICSFREGKRYFSKIIYLIQKKDELGDWIKKFDLWDIV